MKKKNQFILDYTQNKITIALLLTVYLRRRRFVPEKIQAKQTVALF